MLCAWFTHLLQELCSWSACAPPPLAKLLYLPHCAWGFLTLCFHVIWTYPPTQLLLLYLCGGICLLVFYSYFIHISNFLQCCSHISLQNWKTIWFILIFKLGNWCSGQECDLVNVNKDSSALVCNLYFLPRLSTFNKINLYFDFSIFLINEKLSLRGELELTCSLSGQCS